LGLKTKVTSKGLAGVPTFPEAVKKATKFFPKKKKLDSRRKRLRAERMTFKNHLPTGGGRSCDEKAFRDQSPAEAKNRRTNGKREFR